jgi:hypothetical protein
MGTVMALGRYERPRQESGYASLLLEWIGQMYQSLEPEPEGAPVFSRFPQSLLSIDNRIAETFR